MAGFNKVILIGNLTRNPELRYTPNGTPVASMGLAVSRRYKQGEELKEEVCFVDIIVFGKQAVAPDLDNAQSASVFGRHVEHRLYRQAQGCLKKGKGIQQPVAAARCALADNMRVQGVASPRADRDRMKKLVPLA